MLLLGEKCGEPPVLDLVVPLHALPHETVRELAQHNVHLPGKQLITIYHYFLLNPELFIPDPDPATNF